MDLDVAGALVRLGGSLKRSGLLSPRHRIPHQMAAYVIWPVRIPRHTQREPIVLIAGTLFAPNQSQTLQLTADRDDERNSFSLEDTKTPTSSQEEAKKPRRPSRSQGKSSVRSLGVVVCKYGTN